MAQILEILPSPFQHGWPMGIILPIAEGFPVDNHLVFGIDQGLAVVALDHPMGRLHLGRLVVREVAARPGSADAAPVAPGLFCLPDLKGDRLGYLLVRAP